MMKTKLLTISTLLSLLPLLGGCSGGASEADKAYFHRSTMGYDNAQEQTEFNQAVNPDYAPVTSGPPAWEAPVN